MCCRGIGNLAFLDSDKCYLKGLSHMFFFLHRPHQVGAEDVTCPGSTFAWQRLTFCGGEIGG